MDVVRTGLDQGVLFGSAGDRVIRIAPPLIVTESELDHGVATLAALLRR
jgi:4-aminobutyrate aminotransferase-like enzyme